MTDASVMPGFDQFEVSLARLFGLLLFVGAAFVPIMPMMPSFLTAWFRPHRQHFAGKEGEYLLSASPNRFSAFRQPPNHVAGGLGPAWAASHGISPAARIRSDVARVDDPIVSAGELYAFPCHGIEVEPDDHPADHRGPDVAVSAGRHRSQSLDGLHSVDVGNSNRRTPATRPSVHAAFFVRGAASLPIGAAVLRLVVSADRRPIA